MDKSTIDDCIQKADGLINFIPREFGRIGEDRFGLAGKYGGITIGYSVDILLAGALPFIGEQAPYVVAFLSPALALYTVGKTE